jgi:flagellin-specific chaperone FliS
VNQQSELPSQRLVLCKAPKLVSVKRVNTMVQDELKSRIRPNDEVLSAYRKGQLAASSIERSVADTYNRMANRFNELEAALRAGEHRQAVTLIERFWLTTSYLTSILDTAQGSDIITRIKALNLFVLKQLARVRRSGLAADVEGIGGVLGMLSEIFLSLDLAKRPGSVSDHSPVQHHFLRTATYETARSTHPRAHKVSPYRRAIF